MSSAATGWPRSAAEEPPAPGEPPPLQAWAEIDLAGLRLNLDYVRAVVPPPAKIMAVVKADAYGHGMVEVARAASEWGCDWLGVGNAAEGLALREAGLQAPCLVLAPVLPGEIEALARAGLALTVADFGVAGQIARAAGRLGRGPVEVHLLVDAGIGRFGVRPRQLPELAREVDRLEALRVGGVYTHFADPLNAARTRAELEAFLWAAKRARDARGPFPLVHAAASEVAVTMPESRLDMVRVGNLLYGFWPGPRRQLPRFAGKVLRPIWTLKARVIAVHEVLRGQGLGYGENRATRSMRVAVLPVGISDGVSLRSVQTAAGPRAVLRMLLREMVRSLFPRRRPHAIIRGAVAPLVGPVGMQFTLVDVTGIADVEVGDEAAVPGVRATAARGLPRIFRS